MSPACSDEVKYDVVGRIVADVQARSAAGAKIAGRAIQDVNTVNGVRFTLEGGAWGLMRASSNTPNLVVVVESPESGEDVVAIFREIEAIMAQYPEVGPFDQKL